MSNMSSPAGTPIEGAVALVTGGHRGFGRAVVDELLERGAVKVYATSRSPRQQRDERIVPLVVDNAGVLLQAPVLGAPLADIRRELETNMDTDMTAGLDVPKADPRDVARQAVDAIAAGAYEVLADDTTCMVKSQLSQDVTALYAQLAA
jgi:NAD(P)-dependent dehydrogenase (short-subunit alcohol dehydrogenase family)